MITSSTQNPCVSVISVANGLNLGFSRPLSKLPASRASDNNEGWQERYQTKVNDYSISTLEALYQIVSATRVPFVAKRINELYELAAFWQQHAIDAMYN